MDVALGVVEVGRTVGSLAGIERHIAAVEGGCAHLNGCAVIGAQTVIQGYALDFFLRLGIVVEPGVLLLRQYLVGIAEAVGGVHQIELTSVFCAVVLEQRAMLTDTCGRTTCIHHHAVGRKHEAVLGVKEDLRMFHLDTCHILAVLDALHAGKVGGAAHFAPFCAFGQREPLGKTLFDILDGNVHAAQLLEELSIVPCLQGNDKHQGEDHCEQFFHSESVKVNNVV